MGEILPDGTIQSGYTGICDKCGAHITTNMQGNETGTHECEVLKLHKPCVSKSVCPNCDEPRPKHYEGEGSCESCAQ